MSEKIVLIDGHSVLNRAFYGVPDLTNYEGLHTNAVYGFLNIMFKILEEEKPQYLVVAFDLKAPTFRHKLYAEYKGTRKGMPEELREQVPLIKEVLQAMGIAVVSKEGYEADDLLGTLATRAEHNGMEATIVSGDRDLLQIASKVIKIKIPKTKAGKTETFDYYAEDVLNEYKLTTEQFIDLKALMGDAADNIPGVPKVGQKTATALLVEYGTIDGIYEHIEEITKKSIKASLIENRHLADLSKELATIKVDCQVPDMQEEARLENLFTKDAYEIFSRLGFKNFLGKFDVEDKERQEVPKATIIRSLEEVKVLFKEVIQTSLFVCHVVKMPKSEEVVGIVLMYEKDKIYFLEINDLLTKKELAIEMKSYITRIQRSESKTTILTFDVGQLYAMCDLDGSVCLVDSKIAAYLINPLNNHYTIENIATEYLQIMSISGENNIEQGIQEAVVCYKSYDGIKEQLEKYGMGNLMKEIEMPLSHILYKMQCEGIGVQKDALKQYGDDLVGRIAELEQSIYTAAGITFNINSPKQLGEILFERLGMKGGKKTKTGYSTAADVLEKLSGEYPIVDEILEYRALAKLKSTYADGLGQCIEDDGRIHSHFNQTITATGRISSTEPNLQNIPMKMELGRRIRKVFIPKEGCVFIDADYSQIELRILAHMSGDETLIRAYQENEDIHRITASQVFGTPFEEVTDLQRRNAKAVNFGIIYGISAFGLSQDLSISPKEAGQYREQYFAMYPKIKAFLDGLIATAKEEGAISTLHGRRRPIPEIHSSNFMQRSFGERVAMNSPIQGTAADIIKIAMIRVCKALTEANLQAKLILQIHDELLIEAPEGEVEIVSELLEREMKAAMDLAVTLEVESHVGHNWYDVK